MNNKNYSSHNDSSAFDLYDEPYDESDSLQEEYSDDISFNGPEGTDDSLDEDLQYYADLLWSLDEPQECKTDLDLSEMSEEEMQSYFNERIIQIDPLGKKSSYKLMTDVQACELYVLLVKGHLIWNESSGEWMTYSSHSGIWIPNDSAAKLYAMRIGKALENYYNQKILPTLIDEPKTVAKEIKGKMTKMQSKNSINSYISFAKCADDMHISANDLDADPNIINCLNGELHLDDLQLHEHNPFSFCTRTTGVNYDPNAVSEDWNNAIAVYMSSHNKPDPEKLAYFQKAVGYSIDGTQSQKKFFILYGMSTNNGKSTLMNAICHALGDYAKQTSVKTFCSKSRGSDGPAEGLSSLSGSRFVAAAEAEQDWPIDCELLKSLTGGDTINVRALYGHNFNLVTTFKVWIHSNWIPNMTDPTIFDSGRVVVIPVDCQFTKENGNLDITMPDKLQSPEAESAILTWMVEGLKKYRDDYDLTPTEEIAEAISEQRIQANKIAQFINECMEQLNNCNSSTRNTYIVYRQWCKEMGYAPLNRKRFLDGIKNLNITIKHARDNQSYYGSGKSTNCLAGWAIRSDIASRCEF